MKRIFEYIRNYLVPELEPIEISIIGKTLFATLYYDEENKEFFVCEE